jgi:hypothetical protein
VLRGKGEKAVADDLVRHRRPAPEDGAAVTLVLQRIEVCHTEKSRIGPDAPQLEHRTEAQDVGLHRGNPAGPEGLDLAGAEAPGDERLGARGVEEHMAAPGFSRLNDRISSSI